MYWVSYDACIHYNYMTLSLLHAVAGTQTHTHIVALKMSKHSHSHLKSFLTEKQIVIFWITKSFSTIVIVKKLFCSRTNVQGQILGAEAVDVLPPSPSPEAEAVDDHLSQDPLLRVLVHALLPERQHSLRQRLLLTSRPWKWPSQRKRHRLPNKSAQEGHGHAHDLQSRSHQRVKRKLSHKGRQQHKREGFWRERQRLWRYVVNGLNPDWLSRWRLKQKVIWSLLLNSY